MNSRATLIRGQVPSAPSDQDDDIATAYTEGVGDRALLECRRAYAWINTQAKHQGSQGSREVLERPRPCEAVWLVLYSLSAQLGQEGPVASELDDVI